MAIVSTLDVFCDYREDADDSSTQCPAWEHGAVGHTVTVAEARTGAARYGWVRRCGPSRREYDLCPDHANHVPGRTCPDWRGGHRS